MSNLKYIEFQFENVTGAIILAESISKLEINSTNKYSMVFTSGKGSIECTSNYLVSNVHIVLKKSANVHFNEYGAPSALPLFERVQTFADIVCIKVAYEDGTESLYDMPWKSRTSDDIDNVYQTSEITDDGQMIIKIAETN